MVLEAVCDQNLWFWHAFYGVAGSMNDLSVLRLSKILKGFVSGEFEKLERDANVVPFSINNKEFKQLFLLVDGIYPKYSRFVKGIKDPLTDQERKYSAWQEAARKDIERAFGVLQCQWKFMAAPIKAYSTDVIRMRVKTCIILHNMNVSDRVMEGNVKARYNLAYKLQQTVPENNSNGGITMDEGENVVDRWA
jgi:Plant transposon protein